MLSSESSNKVSPPDTNKVIFYMSQLLKNLNIYLKTPVHLARRFVLKLFLFLMMDAVRGKFFGLVAAFEPYVINK